MKTGLSTCINLIKCRFLDTSLLHVMWYHDTTSSIPISWNKWTLSIWYKAKTKLNNVKGIEFLTQTQILIYIYILNCEVNM